MTTKDLCMVALVPSKPDVRLTRMAYHLCGAKCVSSASSAAVAYRSPSSSSSRSCALPAAPPVPPATWLGSGLGLELGLGPG